MKPRAILAAIVAGTVSTTNASPAGSISVQSKTSSTAKTSTSSSTRTTTTTLARSMSTSTITVIDASPSISPVLGPPVWLSGPPAFPTGSNNRPKDYLKGPVLTSNFPDPTLINVQGQWFSFATNTVVQNGDNNVTINIQVARSMDFDSWELVINPLTRLPWDALPIAPQWVNMSSPQNWSPDVTQLDDGSYVMYFSAAVSSDFSPTAMTAGDVNHHCVGVATAKNVLGPYKPLDKPFACPLTQGGAIDASGFKDWSSPGSSWGSNAVQQNGWQHWFNGGTQDVRTWPSNDPWGPASAWSQGGAGGQRYVVYKIDGNSLGLGGICGNTQDPIVSTALMLQAVSSDGVTPQGQPVQLLDNRGVSDDGVVEAPSLVKSYLGQYVLFFSSGCFSTPNYTVSYAVADNVTGPYRRAADPLLRTGDQSGLFSPGGATVLWDARHIVLHADQGNSSDVRQLYVGQLDIREAGQVFI